MTPPPSSYYPPRPRQSWCTVTLFPKDVHVRTFLIPSGLEDDLVRFSLNTTWGLPSYVRLPFFPLYSTRKLESNRNLLRFRMATTRLPTALTQLDSIELALSFVLAPRRVFFLLLLFSFPVLTYDLFFLHVVSSFKNLSRTCNIISSASLPQRSSTSLPHHNLRVAFDSSPSPSSSKGRPHP